MDTKKKITISWSGGKDSAFALYKILLSGEYDVASLHTVINKQTGRVSMHGLREDLIRRQTEVLGIPWIKIDLESADDHATYKKTMHAFYKQCADRGISEIGFGDIFLEDLRQFRLSLLEPFGLCAAFPLWKQDTKMLIDDFRNVGFKTLICAADAKHFSRDALGETIDEMWLKALPSTVDPCGENGEFHTFVYDGPIFKKPVLYALGDVVQKVYSFQKVTDDGTVEKIESAFWFQEIH
ncbi:MAG: ATP-binding protein [Bacteroidota bacterium]